MEALIKNTTALIFEIKENIGDGSYVKLMNNLKEMHKIKDTCSPRPKRMPRTIPLILDAWIRNEPGGTQTGSIWTGSGNLFSYSVQIGYTRANGMKCVVDHTAGGLGFISQTTSCHVGKVKRYCAEHGILLATVDGNG